MKSYKSQFNFKDFLTSPLLFVGLNDEGMDEEELVCDACTTMSPQFRRTSSFPMTVPHKMSNPRL